MGLIELDKELATTLKSSLDSLVAEIQTNLDSSPLSLKEINPNSSQFIIKEKEKVTYTYTTIDGIEKDSFYFRWKTVADYTSNAVAYDTAYDNYMVRVAEIKSSVTEKITKVTDALQSVLDLVNTFESQEGISMDSALGDASENTFGFLAAYGDASSLTSLVGPGTFGTTSLEGVYELEDDENAEVDSAFLNLNNPDAEGLSEAEQQTIEFMLSQLKANGCVNEETGEIIVDGEVVGTLNKLNMGALLLTSIGSTIKANMEKDLSNEAYEYVNGVINYKGLEPEDRENLLSGVDSFDALKAAISNGVGVSAAITGLFTNIDSFINDELGEKAESVREKISDYLSLVNEKSELLSDEDAAETLAHIAEEAGWPKEVFSYINPKEESFVATLVGTGTNTIMYSSAMSQPPEFMSAYMETKYSVNGEPLTLEQKEAVISMFEAESGPLSEEERDFFMGALDSFEEENALREAHDAYAEAMDSGIVRGESASQGHSPNSSDRPMINPLDSLKKAADENGVKPEYRTEPYGFVKEVVEVETEPGVGGLLIDNMDALVQIGKDAALTSSHFSEHYEHMTDKLHETIVTEDVANAAECVIANTQFNQDNASNYDKGFNKVVESKVETTVNQYRPPAQTPPPAQTQQQTPPPAQTQQHTPTPQPEVPKQEHHVEHHDKPTGVADVPKIEEIFEKPKVEAGTTSTPEVNVSDELKSSAILGAAGLGATTVLGGGGASIPNIPSIPSVSAPGVTVAPTVPNMSAIPNSGMTVTATPDMMIGQDMTSAAMTQGTINAGPMNGSGVANSAVGTGANSSASAQTMTSASAVNNANNNSANATNANNSSNTNSSSHTTQSSSSKGELGKGKSSYSGGSNENESGSSSKNRSESARNKANANEEAENEIENNNHENEIDPNATEGVLSDSAYVQMLAKEEKQVKIATATTSSVGLLMFALKFADVIGWGSLGLSAGALGLFYTTFRVHKAKKIKKLQHLIIIEREERIRKLKDRNERLIIIENTKEKGLEAVSNVEKEATEDTKDETTETVEKVSKVEETTEEIVKKDLVENQTSVSEEENVQVIEETTDVEEKIEEVTEPEGYGSIIIPDGDDAFQSAEEVIFGAIPDRFSKEETEEDNQEDK